MRSLRVCSLTDYPTREARRTFPARRAWCAWASPTPRLAPSDTARASGREIGRSPRDSRRHRRVSAARQTFKYRLIAMSADSPASTMPMTITDGTTTAASPMPMNAVPVNRCDR